MTRFTLSIDQETRDLALGADGGPVAVYDAEAIAQHVRQRLGTYFGEWFLDTSCGVRWIQDIFGRQYSPDLATAIVKREILNTEGVTGIDTFSISFDPATRGLHIRDVRVRTVFDRVVKI